MQKVNDFNSETLRTERCVQAPFGRWRNRTIKSWCFLELEAETSLLPVKELHTSALRLAEKLSLKRPVRVRKHYFQFLQTSELLSREISNLRPHLALPAC